MLNDNVSPNGIPVITVTQRTLAAAYEDALVKLHNKGMPFKTQYDKPGDPPSLDCTADITILQPLSEPMIHKAFPGGPGDLREYVMELEGVKDGWVKDMFDPLDTRWEYTYHGRLASYGGVNMCGRDTSVLSGGPIDQVGWAIGKLSSSPYTRQAQIITWVPALDMQCYDPPCLQSLWYRLTDTPDSGYALNCNVRIRSNDAWGANFMNMFGFTMFNKDVVAAGIERMTGKKVTLGRMNWHADSFHVYGKDLDAFKKRLIDRLDLSFSQRVMEFSDPEIRAAYDEATADVLRKVEQYRQDKAAELAAKPVKTVKACPRCGRIVMQSCFHDGRDIRSVDMDVEQAKKLLCGLRDGIRNELADVEGHMRKCY
jgi:thymidylate synthase